MHIFQVLEKSTNAAVLGNQTWYRNLYEPLAEMLDRLGLEHMATIGYHMVAVKDQ